MARTVYFAAASLDGFIVSVQDCGQWAGKPGGAIPPGIPAPAFPGIGAVAMGAHTYRSYTHAPESWPHGSVPAWIFTHREFSGISGANITFVRGDVAEFHPDIVFDAGGRDIFLAGENLAAQFLGYGLVDQVVLTVLPVTLGSGRPVLPDRNLAEAASLVGERALGQGMVQQHYDLQR